MWGRDGVLMSCGSTEREGYVCWSVEEEVCTCALFGIRRGIWHDGEKGSPVLASGAHGLRRASVVMVLE